MEGEEKNTVLVFNGYIYIWDEKVLDSVVSFTTSRMSSIPLNCTPENGENNKSYKWRKRKSNVCLVFPILHVCQVIVI